MRKELMVKSILVVGALLFAGMASANPIPLPGQASKPFEEMNIQIDSTGHAAFNGRFFFDYIRADVQEILFPLPPANATNVQVYQNSVPLPWTFAADTYPTVLPEYPSLPMFAWSGPFPEQGAVFDVTYEHDLFPRDGTLVFFYSLGTGKYFPTSNTVTMARFTIDFPSSYSLVDILLDSTAVDPSLYTLTGTELNMMLISENGPFTKDLILVFAPVPEPASLLLFGAGLLGLAGFSLRWQAAGPLRAE